MKPFYQGKLDIFCALYAVLNALQLTHGIRTLKAREIFHDTLASVAANPEAFREMLDQRTDYISLVDGMLRVASRIYPLRVEAPFTGTPDPSPRELWRACSGFMAGGGNRTLIFRFLRYMTPEAPPLNRHWTAAEWIENDTLHLFDCSHEAAAILNITKTAFVTYPAEISADRLLCIEPASVRFLSSKF